MSESLQHIALINLLKGYFREIDAADLHVEFSDEPSNLGSSRPEIIGGSRPDLIWKTPFNVFRLIGEAKTRDDINNDHSQQQFLSFLTAIRFQEEYAQLVVAVPWGEEPTARSVLGAIAKENGIDSKFYTVISDAPTKNKDQ